MGKNIYMLCVDDEAEVLEAVERDLSSLENQFPLEIASSAAEARAVLKKIVDSGDELGVIFCDHVMPDETGVELLTAMEGSDAWAQTRKVLLTGQASQEATIEAINRGGLDHFVAKPWTKENLINVARAQLTEYVIRTDRDPLPYLASLDAAKLSAAIYRKGIITDS